jgi:hypothetical protein
MNPEQFCKTQVSYKRQSVSISFIIEITIEFAIKIGDGFRHLKS